MTRLYHQALPKPLTEIQIKERLRQLPPAMAGKFYLFRDWKKAHAWLLGKFLVQRCLRDLDIDFHWSHLQYTPHGRPFINGTVDFNLSHSGGHIVCAVSDEATVGVDIEEIKQRTVKNYSGCFTDNEWVDIVSANDPLHRFYEYWTKKEAGMKADGRGLNIAMKKVSSDGDRVTIDQRTYQCYPIETRLSCKIHLAASTPLDRRLIKELFAS